MDRKLIGERIRGLREEKGQSMAHVARQLKLPYSTYFSYEYGLRLPSDPVKIKLAEYFGVPIETIFFD